MQQYSKYNTTLAVDMDKACFGGWVEGFIPTRGFY